MHKTTKRFVRDVHLIRSLSRFYRAARFLRVLALCAAAALIGFDVFRAVR